MNILMDLTEALSSICPQSQLSYLNGPCAIGNNYKIRVETNAILEFGEYTFFRFFYKIYLYRQNQNRSLHKMCIWKSNNRYQSHFVYNEKNNKVARKKGSIEIGDFNWIGNRTTITKGTKTKRRNNCLCKFNT